MLGLVKHYDIGPCDQSYNVLCACSLMHVLALANIHWSACIALHALLSIHCSACTGHYALVSMHWSARIGQYAQASMKWSDKGKNILFTLEGNIFWHFLFTSARGFLPMPGTRSEPLYLWSWVNSFTTVLPPVTMMGKHGLVIFLVRGWMNKDQNIFGTGIFCYPTLVATMPV